MSQADPIAIPDAAPLQDGVVTLRALRPEDRAVLVASRDAAFHKWLGAGGDDPRPSACIEHAGELVGWIDADDAPSWLQPGEANVGYHVFAQARGRGLATRALQLLLHHLGGGSRVQHAVLLIDPGNAASLAVAQRAGFQRDFAPRADEPRDQWRFTRAVPQWRYHDGVVGIRPRRLDDLALDLAAIDAVQQRWLWSQENVQQWMAMSDAEQRAHQTAWLALNVQRFATGPVWGFSVDLYANAATGTSDVSGVGYIECDLANPHVPQGTANISYAVHPAFRGRGVARRAVGCALQFLREHTAARAAHLRVDARNLASCAVAAHFGAEAPVEHDGTDLFRRWVISLS